jgi:urease accessory protein
MLVLAAADAAERLAALRDALAGLDAECGASAWDGLLVARILASDNTRLRPAIVAGMQALRAGRPLPRVWLC